MVQFKAGNLASNENMSVLPKNGRDQLKRSVKQRYWSGLATRTHRVATVNDLPDMPDYRVRNVMKMRD